MKKNLVVTFSLLLAILNSLSAQTPVPFVKTINNPNKWVDSVFKKMSRNEKIAQLFMVRAHTDLGQKYADSVALVIKKQQLGGVVFFQGGPGRQAVLTNQYQALAKIPLMIAMDAEWGLGMRLDSTVSYPYQMTLGAIQNNRLIYQMGQEVAKDFKRLGMHINFAPVMDINNNPRNPVINYRSFGDNKFNVAQKSICATLPTTFTFHTFIFRIIWCNTAATNFILIKIKLISGVSIDDLLYLNTITVRAGSDTFHTLKLSLATDSE